MEICSDSAQSIVNVQNVAFVREHKLADASSARWQ